MNCKNCGYEMSDDSNTCPYCGSLADFGTMRIDNAYVPDSSAVMAAEVQLSMNRKYNIAIMIAAILSSLFSLISMFAYSHMFNLPAMYSFVIQGGLYPAIYTVLVLNGFVMCLFLFISCLLLRRTKTVSFIPLLLCGLEQGLLLWANVANMTTYQPFTSAFIRLLVTPTLLLAVCLIMIILYGISAFGSGSKGKVSSLICIVPGLLMSGFYLFMAIYLMHTGTIGIRRLFMTNNMPLALFYLSYVFLCIGNFLVLPWSEER